MAKKKPDHDTFARAREKLEQCSHKAIKPTLTDLVLRPSDQRDWKIIRFFNRINESVKKEFRRYQKDEGLVEFKEAGELGKGNTIGQHWDKKISEIIKITRAAESSKDYRATFDSLMIKLEREMTWDLEGEWTLLQKISCHFGFEIKFLDSHFTLHGYMCSKTKKSPKIYLWQGDADAVGWYTDSNGEGKYVIVDWKVVDILEFWKKNADAYGRYLHQCLIYARLLQLHLKLEYLPHILIVPINGINGRQAHPVLFYDYPEMCKEMIDSFEWSTTLPEPSQKISQKSPLLKEIKVGKVDENMLLTKLFREDAKVSDLLKEFEWLSLEITADEIKNE